MFTPVVWAVSMTTVGNRDDAITAERVRDLVGGIRTALVAAADPTRAAAQQRYMKSRMPFHGIAMPQLRRLVTQIVSQRDHRLDADGWRQAVLRLWDRATHREERYAALVLARHRLYRTPAQRVASLAVYEHLVRTGAWWDLVDETAHLVGAVLAADRPGATPVIRGWARDEDRWLRRCAIISQLDHRDSTDTDLLFSCIDANVADPEFFVRKAIGWALRQYARQDPDWVWASVQHWGNRLSPLSRREALKPLC